MLDRSLIMPLDVRMFVLLLRAIAYPLPLSGGFTKDPKGGLPPLEFSRAAGL